MSSSSDLAGESEAVLAFIRERQAGVLRDAISSLETSSPDDLRGVVHSVHGTLGSYGLHSAHACITELSLVLADPATTATAAEQARAAAVETLRAVATAHPAPSEAQA
jgi:hypothetical protein